MSDFATTLPLLANGNVKPFSFVKGDASNALYCLQAGAGDTPVGVTGNYTRYAGGTPADDGFEAIATEGPEIFGAASVVGLKLGATVTPFVFLKPDASGYGTPVTAAADVPGAMALEAGNSGEIIKVVTLQPLAAGPTFVPVISTAVSYTATTSDVGKLIVVTAADKVVTLPTATVAGMRYRVIATGTGATGGATGTTVAIQTGDTLGGNGFTAASGKGAIDTHATAADGDWIEVVSVAANSWYVVGIKGTWARVA